MRVIDYAPFVIQALGDLQMNQTQLTEAVWGWSGRNAAPLVSLLNWMVGKGYVERRHYGRSKLYTATQAGKDRWLKLGEELLKPNSIT